MAKKITGKIVRWQDDKGFGFIQTGNSPPSPNQELFFHISDYRANERPSLNEAVVFEMGLDKKGKPCAKNVQQAEFVQRQLARKNAQDNHKVARQSQQDNKNFALTAWLAVGMVFLLGLGVCTYAKILPIWVLGWYIAINIATFLLYAQDKNAAQTNQWRVQESSLHKLALMGGWTGAVAAHKLLRHKSQKVEFRRVFYLTVLGNLVLLGVLWYFKLK